MSRRICLPLLVALFALAAPAASLAQTSAQAQYQGVAPETSTPVSGGGGTTGGGTVAHGAGTSSSTGASHSSGSSSNRGGTTSGASGNGGGSASSPASSGTGQSSPTVVAAPHASTSTSPFSGSAILWIVIALAGLTVLGVVLRRSARAPAGV